MSKPFVLAHLSDPHLGPLPRPEVRELASKRLVGYINWRRSRHRLHRRDALDAITRDLHGTQPDHVAVTGDLVNIALPAEFDHARRWLETLGQPADVSVVPGNHDAYVAAAALHRDRHWSPYMAGDDGLCCPPSPLTETAGAPRDFGAEVETPVSTAFVPGLPAKMTFPYLRRRGPVALIGVSTAIATLPFMATGKVGEEQAARVAQMLADLREENMFRIVMIHHPPLPSARHKCLIDAAAFQRSLAAAGAELVIHGHDHVHSLVWIAGNRGRVPVIGVPSASASTRTKMRAGAYNLYFISSSRGAWSCEVVSRGLRPSGAVAELNRFALSWSESA
ncbi:MAG TPA: metallophosphoesterase [Xanthobacteraceae bacterium]|jgi:3',5'-cyclic AMP phosphodiesterase CpdA|nr:metallophosphoesterase [Xanthobacteraceae bacterium]